MKSLMLLLRDVLADAGTWCGISTTRDLQTITSRFEHEGLSFLTITLPNFGRDFERSLAEGWVGHTSFAGFQRRRGLPQFLGGFLDHVFDRETGSVVDYPCTSCIHSVRQLTLMFGKIHVPCSESRVRKAVKGYVDCETEVRQNTGKLSKRDAADFARVSRLLCADVFSAVDLRVYNGDIVPKHGPGSVADRHRGNHKWQSKDWTQRLEAIFPSGEYLLPNWRYFEYLDQVTFREPGAEIPVKVITVPKTLKTPRIIAVEPTCMMYVQQGLYNAIVEEIEKDDTLSNLLGWKSSEFNHVLARKGSMDGTLATLDLSEASDRVSTEHVELLLANHPHLREGVFACRSSKAQVDGYGIIPLAKFASMGSALTFPIESIVFATIALMGYERANRTVLTHSSLQALVGQVRVYGDDIIIPVDTVPSTLRLLDAFGFRVNDHKSFWTGKFRESCGKEFYDGQDVSICRVRRELPESRGDAERLISLVELRNQLYTAGYWTTCKRIDDWIRDLIPFPIVEDTSNAIGRRSFLPYQSERTDANLHRPLVRAAVVSSRIPSSRLTGVDALLKCLVTATGVPNPDTKHLSNAGRPRSVSIKTRWTTPY